MNVYSGKLVCVNLKRRPDRRKTMRSRLKAISNLPVEFFDAVDGANAASDYLEQGPFQVYPGWRLLSSSNPFHRRDMKSGEVGCALSHYFLWQRVIAESLPWAILVEDDVRFSEEFEVRWANALNLLQAYVPDWDLFYLGRSVPPDAVERRVANGIVIPSFSYTTCGYAISLSGARKLAATHYARNLIPLDEFLPAMYCRHPREDIVDLFKGFPRLKAYAVSPSLVMQVYSDSDTEASGFFQTIGLGSVLRTSAAACVRWAEGDLRVTSQISKTSFEVDAKALGAPILLILNAFSDACSCSEAIERMGECRIDEQRFLRAVESLLRFNALEIVTW